MDVKAISQLLLAVTFVVAFGIGTFFVLATQINTASGRRGEQPRCPSCGVREARASGTRTLRDHLFALFSCAPFRCRLCGSRFYCAVESARSLKNAA